MYIEKRVKKIKIKNKIQKLPNVLNKLIKLNAHYGYNIKKINNSIYPFLLGLRKQNSIINLNITIQQIRQCFYLINLFIQQNKQILLISNNEKLQSINDLLKKLKIKNITILHTKQKINTLIDSIKFYDLLIFMDIKDNSFLVKTAKQKKIPIIAITSTIDRLNNIDFPIIINTGTTQLNYFLIQLFFHNIIKNKLGIKPTKNSKI